MKRYKKDKLDITKHILRRQNNAFSYEYIMVLENQLKKFRLTLGLFISSRNYDSLCIVGAIRCNLHTHYYT